MAWPVNWSLEPIWLRPFPAAGEGATCMLTGICCDVQMGSLQLLAGLSSPVQLKLVSAVKVHPLLQMQHMQT